MKFGASIGLVGKSPTIDSLYSMDLRATEDLTSFFKKMVQKVEIICGRHITLVAYIRENMDCFHNLEKDKVVKTVMPADLSCVGNALQEINNRLQEIRQGKRLDVKEICTDTLKKAGIVCKSGHMSLVDFKRGNWGTGLGKDTEKPIMFHKTIEEFGWQSGAATYASRFCTLVEATNKTKLLDSVKRHFADLDKAIKTKTKQEHNAEEEKIVIEQLRELTACRDALISFYFKNLSNILDATSKETKGEEPDTELGTGDVGGGGENVSGSEDEGSRQQKEYVPDTWTGK